MPFAQPDLRAFCRDMGVPVSYQGVSNYADGQPVLGLFDRPVKVGFGDQGFGGTDIAKPTVSLPFNAFSPMPVNRDLLTVGGIDYTVADTHTEDDGAFIVYELKVA